ncbi:hypothetical protein NSK_007419 [Nannochloropsis salina CCMP1776]|uniref:Uncharacterized protein n=1 Tax=Nannochloropsis salina CCMP1776 TaxID=1027361 RepID=A0A4D9CYD1_9STRA|nr:hypothetical protein NSK_007419 [Nannochloropsis salina CCMP1776]|eukprot:TFJ81458.1 hypothetical protein NSK_007419 [Nannochloropsis salina CCMP1776]
MRLRFLDAHRNEMTFRKPRMGGGHEHHHHLHGHVPHLMHMMLGAGGGGGREGGREGGRDGGHYSGHGSAFQHGSFLRNSGVSAGGMFNRNGNGKGGGRGGYGGGRQGGGREGGGLYDQYDAYMLASGSSPGGAPLYVQGEGGREGRRRREEVGYEVGGEGGYGGGEVDAGRGGGGGDGLWTLDNLTNGVDMLSLEREGRTAGGKEGGPQNAASALAPPALWMEGGTESSLGGGYAYGPGGMSMHEQQLGYWSSPATAPAAASLAYPSYNFSPSSHPPPHFPPTSTLLPSAASSAGAYPAPSSLSSSSSTSSVPAPWSFATDIPSFAGTSKPIPLTKSSPSLPSSLPSSAASSSEALAAKGEEGGKVGGREGGD